MVIAMIGMTHDCLDSVGLLAERHWRRYRPDLVEDLERKGLLYERLVEVQQDVADLIHELTARDVPLVDAVDQAMRKYVTNDEPVPVVK